MKLTAAKTFLISLFLLLISLIPSNAQDNSKYPVPDIAATSYILIDASTGLTLLEKNADVRRPIASLTKIMTCYLALNEIKNEETTFQATSECADAGGSEIYLESGDVFKIEDLIMATMLKSANDAACLLAKATSGRVNIFVRHMNTTASRLGMKNTRYANPHGLDSENHFSTARDQAILALYAISNPEFRKVVSTKQHKINWLNRQNTFIVYNHNKLLFRTDFVKGIKTGFTNKAGHCLATYAEIDGRRFVAVVLNSTSGISAYDDTLKLLDYGKGILKKRKVVRKGKEIPVRFYNGSQKYEIVAATDLEINLPSDLEQSDIEYRFIPTIFDKGKPASGVVKIYARKKLIGLSYALANAVND